MDAQRLHKQRYLNRSCHADGSMTISVELPREQGELVIKALEKALSEFEQEEAGEPAQAENENLQARQADALVQVAQCYLAGDREKSSCTADHYQVMVHVDEEALRGKPTENSKSDLPIEMVRRLCCDGAVVAVKEDEHGNPLKLSRKHHVVQPAVRQIWITPCCSARNIIACCMKTHFRSGPLPKAGSSFGDKGQRTFCLTGSERQLMAPQAYPSDS